MPEGKEEGKRLSYKFRLYPTPEQERYFSVNFGCVRFVYNHFLDARIKAYEATKETLYDGAPNPSYDPSAKPLSFYDTSKALTQLKKETVDEDGHRWLYDADATALVYALRNLDKAYQNFFRRVKQGGNPGFPKFKSRQSGQSFTVGSCKIPNGSHVVLPKIGTVKAKVKREVKGEIVSATISRNAAGQYHVSVNVKEAHIAPLPASDNAVGITMGIQKWVTTSDGEVFDYPAERVKKLEKKLVREQRRLSRKVLGSNNYRKQKIKVARAYLRITNVRSYSMHSLTRRLVNEYGTIVTRDMVSSEMIEQTNKQAKLPGKARRRINHATLNAGFAEINRQLAYKSDWAGRSFVMVPADMPTAQVCVSCGYKYVAIAKDLRSTWECPECKTTHDRKHNGAKNVLEAGLDILGERESSYVSRARKKRKGEDDGQ